jgi:hypothetical protein
VCVEVVNYLNLNRTIGMFEQNNVGVRLTNPIVSFLQNLTNESPEIDVVMEEIQSIADNIDDEGACTPYPVNHL